MQLDVQVLGEVAREAPVFREDVTNGREHGHAAMPLGSAITQPPKPKGSMCEGRSKEGSLMEESHQRVASRSLGAPKPCWRQSGGRSFWKNDVHGFGA